MRGATVLLRPTEQAHLYQCRRPTRPPPQRIRSAHNKPTVGYHAQSKLTFASKIHSVGAHERPPNVQNQRLSEGIDTCTSRGRGSPIVWLKPIVTDTYSNRGADNSIDSIESCTPRLRILKVDTIHDQNTHVPKFWGDWWSQRTLLSKANAPFNYSC